MTPYTGYAMREDNIPIVDELAWTGVEIDFQRANHPTRIEPYLNDLRFEYVSVHTLDLSVSGTRPPSPRYLDSVLAVAAENGAVAITDHLGFNDGERGGPAVGHVTSPPFSVAALDATCRNIDTIQKRFGDIDFYVENLAHFFLFDSDFQESEFICRVLDRTGCGLLLDVTNVYANVRNFDYDGQAFIRAVVPAARRIQMHMAGGFFHAEYNRYIDSHSEPIPPEVWQLYEYALELGRGKVDAVFIERDWNFPDEEALRSELRRVRAMAEATEAVA